MDFVGFLSMIIYEVLYTPRCLRYDICSTWFLDNRISTCSQDQFRDYSNNINDPVQLQQYVTALLKYYKNVGLHSYY